MIPFLAHVYRLVDSRILSNHKNANPLFAGPCPPFIFLFRFQIKAQNFAHQQNGNELNLLRENLVLLPNKVGSQGIRTCQTSKQKLYLNCIECLFYQNEMRTSGLKWTSESEMEAGQTFRLWAIIESKIRDYFRYCNWRFHSTCE